MSRAITARQRRYRRGVLAEYFALILLASKAYLPIVMRYKTPVGEIDLIMRRGRTLVFVEVKARRTQSDAATAIHAKNQSRVVRASQYFLASHPEYAHHAVRFDAVLVAWYRWPRHLLNAFG